MSRHYTRKEVKDNVSFSFCKWSENSPKAYIFVKNYMLATAIQLVPTKHMTLPTIHGLNELMPIEALPQRATMAE